MPTLQSAVRDNTHNELLLIREYVCGSDVNAEKDFTIITPLEVWPEVNSSICESGGDPVFYYRDEK